MKILCIAIGKRHDPDIADAINDYSGRVTRYSAFDWLIIAPAKGRTNSTETKRIESAALLDRIKDDDYIVLLDETGTQLGSDGLAAMLGDVDMSKRIVFIIGGAYGVEDSVKQRADVIWSLSKLVFPHQLVRLIVAEQLYRAHTILRGEPYHHE